MNDIFLYSLVMLFGVVISAFSQILLKKSTQNEVDRWWKEYLNIRVIVAYSIFVLATFCSIYAYKVVPLSMGPILTSTEYVFVALLSKFFLKEVISRRTMLGIVVIVLGIIVYSIGIE